MNVLSLGPVAFYGELAEQAKNNKHHWRKVARFLGKIRHQLQPRLTVRRDTQLHFGKLSIEQALIDTKLPEAVKMSAKKGLAYEFQFIFDDLALPKATLN